MIWCTNMKHAAFTKSFFKNIIHNFSRLLSIICIVILGVGFLVGLLTSSPNIKNSIDYYYDQYNVSDINVISTLGIDEEDKNIIIENVSEIENYKLEKSVDDMISYHNNSLSAKIIYYDFDSVINQIELKEGRLPQEKNECVVNISNNFLVNVELDSTLTYEGETYTVVGKVLDPNYFDNAKVSTSIGKGYIESIVYLNQDFFEIDYYTNMYVTIKDVKDLNSFSSGYNNIVDPVREKIENLDDKIKEEKFDRYYQTIYDEVYNQYYEMIKLQVEEYLNQQFPGMSFTDEQIEGFIKQAMEQQNIYQQIEDKAKEVFESQFDEDSFALYVLDRDSYQAFRSIKENVQKIEIIALIFPVFFFLVAALVVLTTMTRMVEEERLQIGTLKSLGYFKKSIMANYIGYGLFSSILGGLLGVAAGIYILPYILYQTFAANYILPTFKIIFSYPYILISFFSMVLIILLTTILTVNRTLKEKPSELMLKRAPKPGKKILLERITFIWKHIKFNNKSALRNVFRYKKHMIMTIVGVSGCTALLVAGFGIKDSFDQLVHAQYQEIINYQLALGVKDVDSKIEIIDEYEKTSYYSQSGYVYDEDKNKYDLTIVRVNDVENIDSFIKLDTEFTSTSVIVSKQLNDIIKESSFTLYDQNNNTYQVNKTDSYVNYISNYIFFGKDIYDQIFKNYNHDNYILVKIPDFNQEIKDNIFESLKDNENVNSIEFISDTQDNYQNMFKNITNIVYFLVLASGALAIIVIYNLTNINIIERNKEIATLKVLGYKRFEVANYVYKETFILTTLGTLVGLLLGYLLHLFIMVNVDSNGIILPRYIAWYSYIYSILLTYLFLIIVDAFLYFKLEKIQMVESLKSNE